MKFELAILLMTEKVDLDEHGFYIGISLLQRYLRQIKPLNVRVQIYVPERLRGDIIRFPDLRVSFISGLDMSEPTSLKEALAELDIDLVYQRPGKEPGGLQEGRLYTDSPEQLLREIEIFVRGFDIPWSFKSIAYNQTWDAFYLMAENSVFTPLLLIHSKFQETSSPGAEFVRALIYNSLPFVRYSRDRFDFYLRQRRIAIRRQWIHQPFGFELGYALTAFYLLTYSALDQLALALNATLGLGISEKQVGFRSAVLSRTLRDKWPNMAKLIQTKKAQLLTGTLQLLRHHAAHRGVLMLTEILEEREFSDDDLQTEIARRGWDDYSILPEGELRAFGHNVAKTKARLSLSRVIAGDVLVIERDKKRFIISPSPDRDCDYLTDIVCSVLTELATNL